MSGGSQMSTEMQSPMESIEALDSDAIEGDDGVRIPSIDYDPMDYSGNLTVLQAQVLLEDAVYFRSIHHKLDATSLRIYRFYHSLPNQILLGCIFAIVHLLAIFESPSSLSWTSDIRKANRINVPCWLTQVAEIVCLLLLLLDVMCKTYFFGRKRAKRNLWLLGYWATLLISILDWMVSIVFFCSVFRVRRFLRPFFLLQNSSIMKKTIKCLRNSVAEVFSVLLFLAVHIYLFTLVGMCIFPDIDSDNKTDTSPTSDPSSLSYLPLDLGNSSSDPHPTPSEPEKYFRNFATSFFNLLVLVTTANHPDVMMPIYNQNRIYAIYFVVFVVIGLYCLTNMLTAVVFNQFRGYFLSSIQTQLFRRRVAFAAAFHVLLRGKKDLMSFNACEPDSATSGDDSCEEGIPTFIIRRIISGVRMRSWKRDLILSELHKWTGCVLNYREFRQVMALMDETTHQQVELNLPRVRNRFLSILQKVFISRWFDLFGMFVCVVNVIVITVEVTLQYESVFGATDSGLEYINDVFVAFYLFEQLGKIWAYGLHKYISDKWNIFDMLFTAALVVIQIIQVIVIRVKNSDVRDSARLGVSFWDGARIVNLLIILRLLRLVPRINAMRLVGSTIRDLLQNLKSFAGVLVLAYYNFALLGMELFGGRIEYKDLLSSSSDRRTEFECGSYAQLNYWANNFDDFIASIMTLWDIMVVNNWQVIVEAYAKAVGQWSRLFFVAWWLLSVLVILNLVVALIIENFIQRWDKCHSGQPQNQNDRYQMFQSLSLYAMFKSSLQEPPLQELVAELQIHPDFGDVDDTLMATDPGVDNVGFDDITNEHAVNS